MTSYLPSYIQKRLLRFVLLKTGLFESENIDLDSFDIVLGRRNVIELRKVELNVKVGE